MLLVAATGDDSGDEDDEDEERRDVEDEEDGEGGSESPVDERAPSPEAVLLKSSGTSENVGPTEDDDADFEKELAKMVTDNADNRKVDKKTALALWEQTVPAPIVRKKRGDDGEDAPEAKETNGDTSAGMMKFTLFTKKGNKPQVRRVYLGRSYR